MANHFSALKRARQTEKRTVRNRANSSRLRSTLRNMRESLAKGDQQAADQVFRQGLSAYNSGDYQKAMRIWMPLAGVTRSRRVLRSWLKPASP